MEDKIEKALQKEKDTKSAEKTPLESKTPTTCQAEVAAAAKPDADKSVSAQPPKPKVETQSTIATPPPVSSIDSNKTKDSSKVL